MIKERRQPGETEEGYIERIRKVLQRESGLLLVSIDRCYSGTAGRQNYVIRGYLRNNEGPAIRVKGATLPPVMDAFRHAAYRLRGMKLKGETTNA